MKPAFGIAAAGIVLGVAGYVFFRWRRAPAAFRAMIAVGGASFLAGVLAAMAGYKVVGNFPSGPLGARTGKVRAVEVGKAVLLTDEKHAGESMWVSSAEDARLCDQINMLGGATEVRSPSCRAAYLAEHALGKELDHGPHDEWLSLDDVADLCNDGVIDKGFPLCAKAYAARHARMR